MPFPKYRSPSEALTQGVMPCKFVHCTNHESYDYSELMKLEV